MGHLEGVGLLFKPGLEAAEVGGGIEVVFHGAEVWQRVFDVAEEEFFFVGEAFGFGVVFIDGVVVIAKGGVSVNIQRVHGSFMFDVD